MKAHFVCLSIEILLVVLARTAETSPVSPKAEGQRTPSPVSLCVLQPTLGSTGLATLAEHCNTLDQFTGSPPQHVHAVVGSSVYVCCPNEGNQGTIFFNDDNDGDDDDDPVDGEQFLLDGPDYVSGGVDCDQGSSCTDIDLCSDDDFEDDEPPQVCGTTDTGKDRVCCKSEQVGERKAPPPEKKYGTKDYDCTDFSKECERFAGADPASCDDPTQNFMRIVCMKSCKRCGDKGCVDEFSMCEAWSRAGHCIKNPSFMFFNCRESCGACGFRSPLNNETQIVEGREYSDVVGNDLFCGEGKLKQGSVGGQNPAAVTKRDAPDEAEDFELFAYANTNTSINCGATFFNDRFILVAAHCSAVFASTNPESEKQSIILRHQSVFEERLDVRRMFVHPNFSYPKLYNDIAVGELDRRIIFDFDKFGDSPTCLGREGEDLVGRTALVQGYGYNENDETSSTLHEGIVTVISNGECDETLRSNTTNKSIQKASLHRHLSDGITPSLMCSSGIYNEERKVFSGPCRGDSGGPLYVDHPSGLDRKRQTLEGIVSGGLMCGKNTPSWYTRVSAFRPWIECVVTSVGQGYSKEEVENACNSL